MGGTLRPSERALLGAVVTAAALAACSDGSRSPGPGDAGRDSSAGGDSSIGSGGAAGGTAGGSGTGGTAGTAGTAGADASADSASDATADANIGDAQSDHVAIDGGDAGVTRTTLFSVAPGARGLAGTAVELAADPSDIYGAVHTPGCHECHAPANAPGPPLEQVNTLELSRAALGLAPGDDVDAIARISVRPTDPLFHFSLSPGGTAEARTEASESAMTGKISSDIFSSRGDELPGANALFVDRVQLGLATADSDAGTTEDDVDALDVGSSFATRLFFSVTPSAMGGAGTAVASTAAADRGCTVFESAFDGSNSVVFSCAALGLAADDDIDALVVFGSGTTPTDVLFSVTEASTGAPGTAVETERLGPTGHAADVFSSIASTDNTLTADAARLGLLGTAGSDDIDALYAEEVPREPTFEPLDQCTISTPLDASELPVFTFVESGILLEIQRSVMQASVRAYDLRNACSPAASGTTVFNQDVGDQIVAAAPRFAAFPLDRDDPLGTLDLWLVVDAAGTSKLIHLGGNEHSIESLAPGTVRNLVHYSGTDLFELAYDDGAGHSTSFFQRPLGAGGTIPISARTNRVIPAPCGSTPSFVGIDPESGGIAYADANDPARRICWLTREGHQRKPPGRWQLAAAPNLGFIDPRAGRLYTLTLDVPGNRVTVDTLSPP